MNNNNKNNVQIVYQHNRKFQGENINDDYYSQGEYDDEEITRVSDPFEDSESSAAESEPNRTFPVRVRFGSVRLNFQKAGSGSVQFDSFFKMSVRVRIGSFSLSDH